MRIIHTADWHIGQTLNGWTREREHRAFFAELGDILEAQEADALIMAGDVFDGINPSGDALRLFYEALVGFRRRRPRLRMVLVAGNHDPAGRLEAPDGVLRAIGVHVVGALHRRDGAVDLARHLVPLPDGGGDVRAHVLAIPFLRAADLPGLSLGEARDPGAGSPVVAATGALLEAVTAAALAAAGGLPVIGVAHLHCAGGTESEGAERRILIGGEHAVPPGIFPGGLAYVALGHLHRPQSFENGRVRYAGAPFPLSVAEIGYRHGVTLIEIGAGAPVATHLPLRRPVDCHRLPAQGSATPEEIALALDALALDPGLDPDWRPFVNVVAQADRPTASLVTEVNAILARYPVRCAGIRIERRPADGAGAVAPPVSLAETTPEALFRTAFEDRHGAPPDPLHLAAFSEALREV